MRIEFAALKREINNSFIRESALLLAAENEEAILLAANTSCRKVAINMAKFCTPNAITSENTSDCTSEKRAVFSDRK